MTDGFAWDKNAHDSKTPPELTRATCKCTCGGIAFVELRQLAVVREGPEVRLDTMTIANMCVKCRAIVHPNDLLKQVLNEGK